MPSVRSKRQQQSTNTAGLRQTTASYIRSLNANGQEVNTFDAGYFPLRATRFPPGTPFTAKRSRKLYSDLADEREFLSAIRDQWVKKLEDLKEDHKYLKKMKVISKEELVDVDPLFAREEEKPIEKVTNEAVETQIALMNSLTPACSTPTQDNTLTEASINTSTEASVGTSAEASIGTSAEASIGTSAEASIGTSAEASIDNSTDASIDTSTDTSTKTQYYNKQIKDPETLKAFDELAAIFEKYGNSEENNAENDQVEEEEESNMEQGYASIPEDEDITGSLYMNDDEAQQREALRLMLEKYGQSL